MTWVRGYQVGGSLGAAFGAGLRQEARRTRTKRGVTANLAAEGLIETHLS